MHLQALMLAASVDGVAAIQLLLKNGATIELQVSLPCLWAAGGASTLSLCNKLLFTATSRDVTRHSVALACIAAKCF